MATNEQASEALLGAQRRDPSNPFVASCEKFLAERGYLTDKQVASLLNVRGKAERAFNNINWGSDHYSRDDYGLSNSWDWAGGN